MKNTGEFYRFNQDDPELTDFPHIDVLGHIDIYDSSKIPLPMHLNDGIELCFIYKGHFQWQIVDKTYDLYPNTSSFTLPWQLHGSPLGYITRGELGWLVIKVESFSPSQNLKLGSWSQLTNAEQKWIGEILKNSPRPHINITPFLGELIDQLINTIQMEHPFRSQIVNRALDNLLFHYADILSQAPTTTSADDFIPLLEEKINEDLSHRWQLSDLESISGYGKSQLNQLIKQHTGFSTMAFVNSLRIAEAQRLLKQTELPIAEVCVLAGFESSQHFSIIFKKFTGSSPRNFRKETNK